MAETKEQVSSGVPVVSAQVYTPEQVALIVGYHEVLVDLLSRARRHEAFNNYCDFAACGCETSTLLTRIDAVLAKVSAQ